jgi:hypothetical protein
MRDMGATAAILKAAILDPTLGKGGVNRLMPHPVLTDLGLTCTHPHYDETRLFHTRTQSVPQSKHSPPRFTKPIC